MNWQDIKVSADSTHFLCEGKPIFDKHFAEVLKFHAPGLAPVKDHTGAYHLDVTGKPLYAKRYTRTFGYYCNRAAVLDKGKWFHLDEKGQEAYVTTYAWAGNYQENLCAVRGNHNSYFHINLSGERVYPDSFVYAGDFKDGIACVKTSKGVYRHINSEGAFLHEHEFIDLGIFHKNYATARDKNGWHHIDKSGKEIYQERFAAVEPFYNGFALVTGFDDQKIIIDEAGQKIHYV